VLSTGEQLAAALVLNRADWLASMNYTMAQAMERLGSDWLDRIPSAAMEFAYEPREPLPTPARGKPLSDEQAATVLAVLKRNHDYYAAQGMSRAHMWPQEVADEIRNELRNGRHGQGSGGDAADGEIS